MQKKWIWEGMICSNSVLADLGLRFRPLICERKDYDK